MVPHCRVSVRARLESWEGGRRRGTTGRGRRPVAGGVSDVQRTKKERAMRKRTWDTKRRTVGGRFRCKQCRRVSDRERSVFGRAGWFELHGRRATRRWRWRPSEAARARGGHSHLCCDCDAFGWGCDGKTEEREGEKEKGKQEEVGRAGRQADERAGGEGHRALHSFTQAHV